MWVIEFDLISALKKLLWLLYAWSYLTCFLCVGWKSFGVSTVIEIHLFFVGSRSWFDSEVERILLHFSEGLWSWFGCFVGGRKWLSFCNHPKMTFDVTHTFEYSQISCAGILRYLAVVGSWRYLTGRLDLDAVSVQNDGSMFCGGIHHWLLLMIEKFFAA